MPRRKHTGTARISDLPLPALKLIIRLACGRLIAGSNKYASVCRQWRDADSNDQLEPLQLFVDLRHMPEAEVARALSWMAAHGQQVDVLVFGGSRWQELPPLDLLTKAVHSLTSLTWLEVQQRHSLVLLAPVLDQLPQLQHLAAAVDVGEDPEGTRWNDDNLDRNEDEPNVVMFQDDQREAWWEPPYLGQLCPQLTSLHLRLDIPGSFVLMDYQDQLGGLLPRTLKQLTLSTPYASHHGHGEEVMIDAMDLLDLTVLEQLTLDGIQVADFTQAGPPCVEGDPNQLKGPVALAQQLTALQQLRWYDHGHGDKQAAALLPLAPKLTGYRQLAAEGVGVIKHMTHLTQLKLGLEHNTRPQGIATALAALTGLRELSLDGHFGRNLGDVLQQVAGMASLRSLELEGSVSSDFAREVEGALRKCTQLTSLVLLVLVLADIDFESEFEEQDYWLGVPSELKGLKCLTVQSKGPGSGLGVWPEEHTQLTSLCVRLRYDCIWVYDEPEEVEDEDEEEKERRKCAAEAEGAYYEWLYLGPFAGQPPPPPPPRQQQQPALTYESVARGVLQQVGQWPASLKQVLFQVVGRPEDSKDPVAKPTLWHFTPAAPAGAQQVSVWLEEGDGAAVGWARPLRPCPHLPGAWELQGRGEGSYCGKWAKW